MKWICRNCGASSDHEPEDGDCNPMSIGPMDHTWVEEDVCKCGWSKYETRCGVLVRRTECPNCLRRH